MATNAILRSDELHALPRQTTPEAKADMEAEDQVASQPTAESTDTTATADVPVDQQGVFIFPPALYFSAARHNIPYFNKQFCVVLCLPACLVVCVGLLLCLFASPPPHVSTNKGTFGDATVARNACVVKRDCARPPSRCRDVPTPLVLVSCVVQNASELKQPVCATQTTRGSARKDGGALQGSALQACRDTGTANLDARTLQFAVLVRAANSSLMFPDPTADSCTICDESIFCRRTPRK